MDFLTNERKVPMIQCPEYLEFIESNPFNQLQLSSGVVWKYFDCAPKSTTIEEDQVPLICIHGSSGTAHCFFMQMLELSKKGYRVISVGYPVVWTHEEWAESFDKFMDSLKIRKAHLYGVSLGGFLAQTMAKLFPSRVSSLILTHAICDTSYFNANASLFESAYAYLPDLFLRNLLLESFPKQEFYPVGVGEAIDFQIAQLDTLSQEDLASRITLNISIGASPLISRPGCLKLDDERITILDAMDQVSLRKSLREQLYRVHPGAKQALLKTGGDFVYISRFDEVNMHITVHLRRNATTN